MAYWLIKSEPSKYSWDQFEKDGKTFWDGIRNYAARNNLRAMKKGDEVLFYHSNEGLEIVGIAKVIKEHYQDPTTTEEAWLVVDLKPVKKLKNAVPLTEIKKRQTFSSNGPVTPWSSFCSICKRRRMESNYGDGRRKIIN